MFRDHCSTSQTMVSTVTVIMYLLMCICLFLVSTPNNLYTASKHNEHYHNTEPGLQVIDHSNQSVNSTHSIMSQYPQQSHINCSMPQAPSQQLQHKIYTCRDNRNSQESSSFSTGPAPLIITSSVNTSLLSVSHSSVPVNSLASQSNASFAVSQQSSSSVITPTSLEVLKHHYPQLLKLLPMEDNVFIGELLKNNLLPHNLKAVISSLSTRADKVTKFLDSVIMPSADDLNSINFNILLKVMMNSNDNAVKQLAVTIISNLNQNCLQNENGM